MTDMDCMGTNYKGCTVNGRMEDPDALYTFPEHFQSKYQGGIQDGMFQGNGTIKFAKGVNYFGKFENGKTTEGYFEFNDGLHYEMGAWDYCNGMNERRFKSEYQQGLKPAGRSQLTDQHPPVKIPDGMYDCGDGFYEPVKRFVENYDKEFLRNTDEQEHNWIVDSCRKAWDEPVGVGKVKS